LLLAVVVAGLLPGAAAAQEEDFSQVQIQSEKLADNLYMLVGRGGNLAVSIGKDGAFLVDDQYAPLSEKILAAIRALTPEPVRFVVNTHWHGDHTGGNENLGRTGALIVAHENVRARMSVEQFNATFGWKTPPSPAEALPIVTFADAVTFHWNGETIRAYHVAPAHTDGDAVIEFVGAGVVHMGDVFFNGTYPFIDTSSGGRIDGVIEAVDHVMEHANDSVRLVPGHGPVAGKAELEVYRDVLTTARGRIAKLKAEGMTRDQVIAAKPMAAYDEKWGGGFIKPDVFAGLVFDSLP
jgi:glyoxylase-like metal-dependent hydrolase (beta-lactamase superfamily II)